MKTDIIEQRIINLLYNIYRPTDKLRSIFNSIR